MNMKNSNIWFIYLLQLECSIKINNNVSDSHTVCTPSKKKKLLKELIFLCEFYIYLTFSL